jgi:CDGSH iron-sulfur domain-containing protein 3
MTDPQIAQKSPFVLEMDPGKYAWCACGRSQNQPFCDGSHRDTGITPLVTHIDEKKTIAWCGCKHSNNKPFCDGTHSKY